MLAPARCIAVSAVQLGENASANSALRGRMTSAKRISSHEDCCAMGLFQCRREMNRVRGLCFEMCRRDRGGRRTPREHRANANGSKWHRRRRRCTEIIRSGKLREAEHWQDRVAQKARTLSSPIARRNTRTRENTIPGALSGSVTRRSTAGHPIREPTGFLETAIHVRKPTQMSGAW